MHKKGKECRKIILVEKKNEYKKKSSNNYI